MYSYHTTSLKVINVLPRNITNILKTSISKFYKSNTCRTLKVPEDPKLLPCQSHSNFTCSLLKTLSRYKTTIPQKHRVPLLTRLSLLATLHLCFLFANFLPSFSTHRTASRGILSRHRLFSETTKRKTRLP